MVVDPSRNETVDGPARRPVRSGTAIPLQLAGTPRPLAEALVATGFSYLPERRAAQARRADRACSPPSATSAGSGSAALDLCWVAGGRVDGYYEWGLQPWDLAAGTLVATEAGAEVDAELERRHPGRAPPPGCSGR